MAQNGAHWCVHYQIIKKIQLERWFYMEWPIDLAFLAELEMCVDAYPFFLSAVHLSILSIWGHFPILMCFVLVELSALPLPIEAERGNFWGLAAAGLVTCTHPISCSSEVCGVFGVWHKAWGQGLDIDRNKFITAEMVVTAAGGKSYTTGNIRSNILNGFFLRRDLDIVCCSLYPRSCSGLCLCPSPTVLPSCLFSELPWTLLPLLIQSWFLSLGFKDSGSCHEGEVK